MSQSHNRILSERTPKEDRLMSGQNTPVFNGVGREASQGRFHATIRMTIPAKKRKEALVILGSIIEQTRLEEGCISCRLYQEVKDDRALMLEESWSSKAGLDRHLASDKFRTVLLVVEMSAESPEIRFDAISHSAGIETIEKVRTSTDHARGVLTKSE